MQAARVSDYFSRLGGSVEGAWRRRDYDERAFPEVAQQTLERMPPSEALEGRDVALALLDADLDPGRWPSQRPSDFGQPPLRLFEGHRFYVEVLCWMDGTTTIHQHGFSGAFHVLGGSSVQGLYAFHEKDRVNTSFLLGDLEFLGVELLGRGDTRPIRSGPGCIHSLFHLERPSYTVVVRTRGDVDAHPQYDYQKPHLAEDGHLRDPLLATRDRLWTLLGQSDPDTMLRKVTRFVARADVQSAWHAARAAHSVFGDGPETDTVLGAMRHAHGARADFLPPVLEHGWWRDHLTDQRRRVADPDLRFFLALLLNVPDRVNLQRCVADRYGGGARDRILDWVRRLTSVDPRGRTTLMGLDVPTVIPGLKDEPFYELLGSMLEGRDVHQGLSAAFSPELVQAGAEQIATVTAGLARSPLRPLVV